jgi:hypothetical protein
MSASAGQFDALDDYQASLCEVDILCDAAEANQAAAAKYATFNKAALLLIAGKFESFVEAIISEFIYQLNQGKLPSQKIPPSIRLQHTFTLLKDFDKIVNAKHKYPEAEELFAQLGRLWASHESCTYLEITAKFSYGKHGEAELVKLFEKIGVDDIFESVKLTENVDSVSEDMPVVKTIDFRGKFNSVCAMRNNILHEDATPDLNSEGVREYTRLFKEFAIRLDSYLASNLSAIKANAES